MADQDLVQAAQRLEREVAARRSAQEARENEFVKRYGFDAMPTDPQELARLHAAIRADEKPVEPMPLSEIGITTAEKEVVQRCEGCGKDFLAKAILIGGRPLCAQFCPTCIDGRETQEQRDRRETREIRWEALCPEDYRETDVERIRKDWSREGIRARDAKTKAAVTLDELLGTEGTEGLILAGESGLRKTRIMFEILRRLHHAGWRCAYLNGATFADQYASQFGTPGGAERFINRIITAPVLFYDDLGKEPLISSTQRMSDRSEEALYRIVEERKAHRRKLLATGNVTGDVMLKRLSEDRGMPIVRRLREMCRTVIISKNV